MTDASHAPVQSNVVAGSSQLGRLAEGCALSIEYTVAQEQRVIVGLTPLETAEFERIDAQIPLSAKPVWPDTANSVLESRWLELYTKHETARVAPHRRFGAYR